MNNPRADIFALLDGEKLSSPPAFSGLIHVTAEGLQREGLALHEVHHDARKMARAAASTFKLTGMPSATLPLDLCAPAEALGAPLNYYENGEMQFPQVKKQLFSSTKYINSAYFQNAEFERKGRLTTICEAIKHLKEDIGNEAVISGMIPGPYTLLLYLIEPGGLFAEMKREPESVLEALFHLSSFLSQIGNAYKNEGADFITIHEMGGSPGFIGPAKFDQFVLPALKELHAKLPSPRVLSVCGSTNKSMRSLAESGADAISVDQLNDLAASRAVLKDVMLFGNIDPVQTLFRGDAAQVHEAVRGAKEAGVDAVWPGCDLVPSTPFRNLKAMME
jgi:[methyl-Co(III) methanol-specific corrinoid protein]:coenzyme M methyltransferase